eukprot:1195273-Prorocentrum_minimum.AAC.4
MVDSTQRCRFDASTPVAQWTSPPRRRRSGRRRDRGAAAGQGGARDQDGAGRGVGADGAGRRALACGEEETGPLPHARQSRDPRQGARRHLSHPRRRHQGESI